MPRDPLAIVPLLVLLAQDAEGAIGDLVGLALEKDGTTCSQVGRALGVTRQAAHARYKRLAPGAVADDPDDEAADGTTETPQEATQ